MEGADWAFPLLRVWFHYVCTGGVDTTDCAETLLLYKRTIELHENYEFGGDGTFVPLEIISGTCSFDALSGCSSPHDYPNETILLSYLPFADCPGSGCDGYTMSLLLYCRSPNGTSETIYSCFGHWVKI